MQSLAEVVTRTLFTHAWQVTAVILIALALTHLLGRNRPHLAHLLWIVVLFKCVTPPFWSSPAGFFSWIETTHASVDDGDPVASAPALAGLDSIAPTSLDGVITPAPPVDGLVSQVETSAVTRPMSIASPAMVVTLLWGSGVLFALAGTTFGWARCLRRIWPASVTEHPELDAWCAELAREIGLRHRVRLIVTSSQLGPGVIGLLRPVIVLPEVLVRSREPDELRAILAHELIHIRRGDLWFGLLQVCAKALWWFYPLVWWISRIATREAERCCDEEVVAHLGCTPKHYARTLLNVLELKSTLHAMPAVPGMKPVEMTSKRLERIMQLEQGCRKRAPRCYWAITLLLAAAVLPGAPIIGAAGVARADGDPSVRSDETTRSASNASDTGRDPAEASLDSTQVEDAPRDDLVYIDLSKLARKRPPSHRVDAGDILGIYVEGILGTPDEPPPVHLPPKGSNLPPAIGYPIPVRSDGTLSLPLVGSVNAKGLTLPEIEDLVLRLYTVDHSFLPREKTRVTVTLMRPRTYSVTVLRPDADVTRGYSLKLPAYENDVLHALAKTGGLPGQRSKNEVLILRADSVDRRERDEFVRQWFSNSLGVAGPWVRIPLRLPHGQDPPFKPDDIVLHEGDVVLVPEKKPQQAVFYTGGLLGGGEYSFPQDYELDVVSAMAMVAQRLATRRKKSSDDSDAADVVDPSQLQLVISRRGLGVERITFSVDLDRAIRNPQSRPVVQADDVLILQKR